MRQISLTVYFCKGLRKGKKQRKAKIGRNRL